MPSSGREANLTPMAAATFDPTLVPPGRRGARRRVITRRSAPPRPVVLWAALAAAGGGLVAVVGLGVAVEARPELGRPGGPATFGGGMTGLVGMYLALLMVLMAARIPVIERVLGQDGMMRWHRRLGPWPITLLTVHAALITIGFAQAARTGAWHEVGVLLRSYPGMLAATVALGLVLLAGGASIRAVRRRLQRETWWVIHLYLYLALALSFTHVLALGPSFVGHPLVQGVWLAVWVATAGVVLAYRFGLPVLRSVRHDLRVVEVRPEAPGVVSVVCRGRRLERLPVSGGQFLCWRFLARGLWWQAHPYSLSALPNPPYLRLTVRQVGDHSAAVARLRPGTRVAIEGPYGALTAYANRHGKALLVAGGIGVTALRALLEDLPKRSDPVVVLRAATTEQLALHHEVAELVAHRRGRVHTLVGGRDEVGDLGTALAELVPDLSRRDVFVCGPEGFVGAVVAAARERGVARSAVHYEIFAW